jgi:hypothetical protein
MTWGKNDDGLHEHPKFRELPAIAIGLWTICRSWSAHNQTDGYLPRDVVSEKIRRHAPTQRIGVLSKRLVDAGLWEVAIGGWMIHDFADWNPTKADRDAIREADARRQRKVRARSVQDACKVSANALQDQKGKVAGQRRVSRRESRPIEVEVEREVLETSSLVPARSAQTIIARWIDAYPGGKPPGRIIGHLAAEVGRLLDEGHPWDQVNAAVAEWHHRSWGSPSQLPLVLSQLQRGITPGQKEQQMGSGDRKALEGVRIREQILAEQAEKAEAREGSPIEIIATIHELGGSSA